MKKQLPDEHHIYLHILLNCWLLVLQLDKIEDSVHYKGMLKNRAKLLIQELSKIVDCEMEALSRHPDIGGLNLNGLISNHHEFIEELNNHFTSDFPILTSLLKQYRDDPEFVLKQLDITVNVEK